MFLRILGVVADMAAIRTSYEALQPVLDERARRQPVISVDTKKQELVGDFKNNGRESRPQGKPDLVRMASMTWAAIAVG